MIKILYNLRKTIFSLAGRFPTAKNAQLLKEIELSINFYRNQYEKSSKKTTLGEMRYSNWKKTNKSLLTLFGDLPPVEVTKRFSRWSLYPHSFRKIRTSIMARDGWRCKNCGTTKDLVVHHIDSDKQNSNEKNLITVCHRHNMQAKFNRGYWEKYYYARIKGDYK